MADAQEPVMVTLSKGQSVKIVLIDTDGEFIVEYGERVLSVTAELADSDGRQGVIYSERFADAYEAMMNREVIPDT